MRLRFDGGTIVLEGGDPSRLAARLPQMSIDPRIGGLRAPACRWPAIAASLARESGDEGDLSGIVQSAGQEPDAVDRTTETDGNWVSPPLRPYQESALVAWEVAERRGIVVLPTGSGKTQLAVAALTHVGRSTLCMVPTRVLVDQWRATIAAQWSGRVGQLGDGTHDVQPITVATFEGAYRHMQTIGDRFALLIVDEAHHFGIGRRDEALEMSIAPFRIGLTATPPRLPEQRARLDELVGPIVYEQSVGDLAGRFLAPFEIFTLYTELSADERVRHDALSARFRAAFLEFQRAAPGESWESFVRHAARSPGGRAAIRAWREARQLVAFTAGKRQALARLLALHAGSRVLVFTSDNASAYEIARQHLVMPITCDIGKRERAAALERFRRGEIRTLVSARVLNEGIDVPDAEVAIIVSGVMGQREHVQRVGRVLRPAEGKRALVYELLAAGTSEPARARTRRASLATRSATHPDHRP